VNLLVTEMGVVRVAREGLVLDEIAPDVTLEAVRKATGAPLLAAPDLKTMAF
jgi:acetate CoA/acetoacetate CoA-transferase beta subunit